MPKFRKRPIDIDAEHFDGTHASYERCLALAGSVPLDFLGIEGFMVPTLEGIMRCNRGNWLVRGVAGEVYPVRDDIFRASYDAVVTDKMIQNDDGSLEGKILADLRARMAADLDALNEAPRADGCQNCEEWESIANRAGVQMAKAIDRADALRAALRAIQADSPPDDWKPCDEHGDFCGYGERSSPGFVDSVDSSNSGDVSQHGYAFGRWAAAKIARRALAAAPHVPLEFSDAGKES